MNMKKEFKVLLVEDNHDHALLAKLTLEKLDQISTVHHIRDGQKTLNYLSDTFSSAIALPNLIILDLDIPEINGFDVMKKIRNDDNFKKLPIVVSTSSSNESDIIRAMDYGIIEYLVKPLNRKKIEEIVHSLQDNAHFQNHIEKKIIPICSNCKKIRNEKGSWVTVDKNIYQDTGIDLSHSICPECRKKLYKGM